MESHTSSFYTQGNGSSTSILPTQNAQVSSVGFNTLKKWNTGSSQISVGSSVNSVATSSNKGLSRLFTRSGGNSSNGKSSGTGGGSGGAGGGGDDHQSLKTYQTNNSDEYSDASTITSTDHKKSGSSMFKFSKSKLKFPSSSSKSSGAGSGGAGGGSGGSKNDNGGSGADSSSGRRPELTLSTQGHHSLRVPKKILTSQSIEESKRDSNRKNSVTSPVSTFHSFFHRAHSSSFTSTNSAITLADSNSAGTGSGSSKMSKMEESLHPHMHHHHVHSAPSSHNPNRTAIGLSSNNSNSAISDISFAMVYNFTDPDYSADTVDSSGSTNSYILTSNNNNNGSSNMDDHTTLRDIQKKFLTPTDQYFQSKIVKSSDNISAGVSSTHSGSSGNSSIVNGTSIGIPNGFNGFGAEALNGLCITSEEADSYFARYLLEFSMRNYQLFSYLLSKVSPIFMPSKERKLSNGSTHAYVGMTLEDLSNFVQESYVKALLNGSYLASYDHLHSGLGSFGAIVTGGSGSGEGSGGSPISSSKRSNKSSSKLGSAGASTSNFSTLAGLSGDTSQIDDIFIREVYQDIVTFCAQGMLLFNDDYRLMVNRRGASGASGKNSNGGLRGNVGFKRDWENIVSMWSYFNERIRYQVVTLFHPLEIFYANCIPASSTLNPINIEIENIVLLSFRDVVILPFLLQRSNLYRNKSIMNQQIATQARASLYSDEEKVLKENDNALLGKVIDCMGVIFTQTAAEKGNADGEEHVRAETFRETFEWLTGII